VLKQMGVVVDRVRTMCAKYKQLTTPAAASKNDIMPGNPDGVAEQQLQSLLLDAFDKLSNSRPLMPLRELEIAAVHSAVTGAIASDTGTSVYAYGPRGSDEWTALKFGTVNVHEWCKQHAKPEPVSVDVFATLEHPAGLYGLILQELNLEDCERLQIGLVPSRAAEAKKKLQRLLFETNQGSSSSSKAPMIIVKIHFNHLHKNKIQSHADQLQQLFEWAHTAGCKLILLADGRTDLAQTLPGLQEHAITPVQVVFNPYTEGDLVARLSAFVDSVVQPAALELCAKHASGDEWCARETCLLAVKLAVSDCDSSSGEVTLGHMKQAVRFTMLE
jgi:Cdc6-like AAA superfamily ATPase